MSFWDSINTSTRYASLPQAFFTRVTPQPLSCCRWVAWNGPLATQFGLPPLSDDPSLLDVFAGYSNFKGFDPLAMKYAGHQFGVYNPELGDGRGLLLCEIADLQGTFHELHLKGAGLTPYSRSGDGRAVLRSTIREYLASEAMHGLGIATTRALGMLVSDTAVYREEIEQGAMLVRTTQSHIRFGHFEHFFYSQQHELLKVLADHVIGHHYPDSLEQHNPYASMFEHIVIRTANMIADWQSVGFAHGVMNTDNMSILGETFDYGPYGFLDDYEPGYICNHSDYQGRYSFERQPSIALWNLTALAHALTPLIDREELDRILELFQPRLQQEYSRNMRAKLGLHQKHQDDGDFFSATFDFLQSTQVDYTRFFRALSSLDREGKGELLDLFVDRNQAKIWLESYLKRCELETDSISERCTRMRAVNPKYILRNYLAQQAIEKAQKGDFSEVDNLLLVLQSPYEEHPSLQRYANLPPQWGKKMVISCSS
jgi:uncharacterized protein YdiU (UPF0061 family)